MGSTADPLKALTIRQPWASLTAYGIKAIETRSQRMNYRGELLIHAGKGGTGIDPKSGYGVGNYDDDESLWRMTYDGEFGYEVVGKAPRGAIIGAVQVTDCVRIVEDQGPHFTPFNGPQDPDVILVAPDLAVGPRARYWQGTQSTDITSQLPLGDFTPGRWAILLSDPVRLPEPVPCRGSQARPWPVPEDAAERVRTQLAEVAHG